MCEFLQFLSNFSNMRHFFFLFSFVSFTQRLSLLIFFFYLKMIWSYFIYCRTWRRWLLLHHISNFSKYLEKRIGTYQLGVNVSTIICFKPFSWHWHNCASICGRDCGVETQAQLNMHVCIKDVLGMLGCILKMLDDVTSIFKVGWSLEKKSVNYYPEPWLSMTHQSLNILYLQKFVYMHEVTKFISVGWILTFLSTLKSY